MFFMYRCPLKKVFLVTSAWIFMSTALCFADDIIKTLRIPSFQVKGGWGTHGGDLAKALTRLISDDLRSKKGKFFLSDKSGQVLVNNIIRNFESGSQRDVSGNFSVVATAGLSSTIGEAFVVFDTHLIDINTSQEIDSKKFEGRLYMNDPLIAYHGDPFEASHNDFLKSALGKACQQAVSRSVAFIIHRLKTIPWEGTITKIMDYQISVDAGKAAGITDGAYFRVYKKGRSSRLVRTLDTSTNTITLIEITNVEKDSCLAIPFQGENYAVGDKVRIATDSDVLR